MCEFLGPIPFSEGSPSISFHLGLLYRAGGPQEKGRWCSTERGDFPGGEEKILPAFEEAGADQGAKRKRADGRRED